jgi:CelD/BcsL family acetyltransferase involved in cellulose biosynthesis
LAASLASSCEKEHVTTPTAVRWPATSWIDRVEVFERPDDALPAWAELESVAPASAYQTSRWLLPWIETVGAANHIRPMIIVVYAANDVPAALFPFGVWRRCGLRVAGFLGGRDSNSNLGLVRPGMSLTRSDIVAVLTMAARRLQPRPDVFVLINQPAYWEGVANPLALLPHQISPSNGYCARLSACGTTFIEDRLSGDARKKLRKKWRKLAERGPVSHIVAGTSEDVTRIVDAFFAQKLKHLRQRNIWSEFETPESRRFLLRVCQSDLPSKAPTVELHAFATGDRIIAVYAGMPHRGRFHAMVNSFDSDPDIARTSPGELLLMSMMQMMCERGYRSFDLGIGEARYKSTWCDETEQMFDTLLGISLKGRAFVLAESCRLRLKRFIKRHDWLWKSAQIVRNQLG